MSRYNTNNPVPSNEVKDFSDNAQIVDEIVHSQQTTTKDRFGNDLKTWQGIQHDANEAIANYGYITMDSFQDGATLTLPNQALRWKLPDGDGEYYRWDGAFPVGGKVVPPGSTPESTGGIGPGSWLSVGDATLRGEVFALNGGVTRGFQIVADMKSFGSISAGHTYSTAGYYTAGDGGGAIYLAFTTGSTPDGYGDHMASNGIFLRLISDPTDLNHGVKVASTYNPSTAWHNRNALQTMLRNTRWSEFDFIANGTVRVLGSIHPLRNYIKIRHSVSCNILGNYDDPSIPESTLSQGGHMFGFARYNDPDNGDFSVTLPTTNIDYNLEGSVGTIFSETHSKKNNNNCIAGYKNTDCVVWGNGGISESDHRGINWDGDAINSHIMIGYSDYCVNNHLMINGSNTFGNTCNIKVGRLGPMRSGGFNTPICVRTQNGFSYNIEIGSFFGDNIVKPSLAESHNSLTVKVKVGYVNGARCLFRQYETNDSDVQADLVFNTPIGIIRAGSTENTMRSARLHDIKATDSNFVFAYDDQVSANRDGFIYLDIFNNNFAYAGSGFRYYNNKNSAGLPIRLNIDNNIPPSGGMTVVEFNKYADGITGNLATIGSSSASINYKAPDWNYSKMSVLAQLGGVFGGATIDLRTRAITNQNVAYSAGAITVNTALSGSTLNLSLTSGATFQVITLHN